MNGAEVRVLREALGLSPKWVAARLGLASDRHLRAVEAGEAPASVRMVALLHELEARAEAEVVVREHPSGGQWAVIVKSRDFAKVAQNTIEFPVDVPANGEATVTYTIRYTW